MKNLLVAIASLALLLPAASALTADAPDVAGKSRWIIGFHELPDDRSTYGGDPVVGVNEAIRFLLVETSNPAALQLRAAMDANVRYVEEDLEAMHATFVPNDTHYDRYQYSMKPATTNMEAAWDRTFGSTSVKLCVIDTGQNRAHEDLKGLTYYFWTDEVNGKSSAYDDNGHGSHVTGTAAASINNGKGVAGVAAGVSIGAAKVLSRSGSGTWTQVANGITKCADAGSHIESLSLGGGASSTLKTAVDYALGKGVTMIAAAGNDGPCSNCVGYPAAYSGVWAISCTEQSNSLCSFSSTGPEVDFAAPGQDIPSTWTGANPCTKRNANTCYVLSSGTSMSTPHVSGLAALVKTQNPTYSTTQIYDRIKSTARDLGASGRDNNFGWGLIQGTAV